MNYIHNVCLGGGGGGGEGVLDHEQNGWSHDHIWFQV